MNSQTAAELAKKWKMGCITKRKDFVKNLAARPSESVEYQVAENIKRWSRGLSSLNVRKDRPSKALVVLETVHFEAIWVYEGPEFTEDLAQNYFPELHIERVKQRVVHGKRLVYMRFKWERDRIQMHKLVKRYNEACPDNKIHFENADSILPHRHKMGVCSHPFYKKIEAEPDSEWVKPGAWVPKYKKFNRKVDPNYKRVQPKKDG